MGDFPDFLRVVFELSKRKDIELKTHNEICDFAKMMVDVASSKKFTVQEFRRSVDMAKDMANKSKVQHSGFIEFAEEGRAWELKEVGENKVYLQQIKGPYSGDI